VDGYLSIKALSAYSGIGVRTLRAHLVNPLNPIPSYRVGGKVLVRTSEFDQWMAQFRRVGNEDVNQKVTEVLRSLADGS
jgi:excisionase family DNA binding protein